MIGKATSDDDTKKRSPRVPAFATVLNFLVSEETAVRRKSEGKSINSEVQNQANFARA